MESSKPKTVAERMKKYRAKKKEMDPSYQQRENERLKAYKRNKKESLTKRELEELKMKKRDEKRLERPKHRNQEVDLSRSLTADSDSNEVEYYPYKCQQTYSKAVLKCLRSLPTCPIKKQCVIQGVAKRLGVQLVQKMEENLNESNKEQDVDQDVKDFYFRSDIVYTCPGMKDCIVIWEKGNKSTLQKHYMTMFLQEAFAIFKEENPDIKIGFSKFCSLRPKNVLLLKDTPSEQCRCKLHENFMMKLKGLKINYSQKFWQDHLCDISLNSRCWKNACDDCKDLKKLDVSGINRSKDVYWKEWSKNNDNKMKLKLQETSAGELLDNIFEDYSVFINHVHIKRIQSEAFTTDKNDPNVRILQVDFSMSYSCEYQNEIQSALWARSSVTLFTAATFYKNQCKSYIICSDCQNKNKDTIFVFINHLYDLIMAEDSNQNIRDTVYSDGPSSEFKNKFMARLIHYLAIKYNKPFSWKYFATSHGKGVIDGIGGNVKRLVRQKTMSQSGSTVIQTAEEFANLARRLVPSTEVIYIPESKILAEISTKTPWEKVSPVPGISRFHVMQCDQQSLRAKRHALDDEESVFQQKFAQYKF